MIHAENGFDPVPSKLLVRLQFTMCVTLRPDSNSQFDACTAEAMYSRPSRICSAARSQRHHGCRPTARTAAAHAGGRAGLRRTDLRRASALRLFDVHAPLRALPAGRPMCAQPVWLRACTPRLHVLRLHAACRHHTTSFHPPPSGYSRDTKQDCPVTALRCQLLPGLARALHFSGRAAKTEHRA